MFLPYKVLIYENFFFFLLKLFFLMLLLFFIKVLKKFVNSHTIVASRGNIWKFFFNLFGRFGREAKSERR